MRQLAFAAFVLTGCGALYTPGPSPIQAGGFVFEQPVLQPAYIPATLRAARDWETATGAAFFSEGGPVYVIQRPGPIPHPGGLADGLAYRRGRTVVLNAAVDPIRHYPIAAHELGHLMGLDHSPLPSDVMAPVVGPLSVISPQDAERARAALKRKDGPP